MSTLSTRVIISKNIKMDREYKHVLNFTEASMLALVRAQGHLVNEISNASFINETGHIYVPFTYSECLQSNYIAFQNPTYSNKWFFAFIDDVKFHSKNMQEISYTVDVWSTWFSYLTVKPCFVVREHTNDDTIGANRIDENLDVGDIVDFDIFETFATEFPFYIAIASTHRPWDLQQGEPADFTGVTCYNKQLFGTELHLIQVTSNPNSLATLIAYIYKMSSQVTDVKTAIQDIFIVPYDLIDASLLQSHTLTQGSTRYTIYTLPYSLDSKTYDFSQITKNYSWSDYTPKNNKCYQFPYNYLYATNNQGNNNIYKYEDFATENPTFKIVEAIGVGCSVIAYPKYYKGAVENIDEAIPLGKYPVCGWSSDSYINYLTQNAVNMPLKIIGDLASPISSMARASTNETLKVTPKNESNNSYLTNYMLDNLNFSKSGGMSKASAISAGTSLGMTALETIGFFYQGSLLPNVSQGGNTGNVHFANNTNSFRFIQKRCSLERIKIIDDYFTMFGYKTNRIKTPNITGRRNFNYIEISRNDCLGFRKYSVKRFKCNKRSSSKRLDNLA